MTSLEIMNTSPHIRGIKQATKMNMEKSNKPRLWKGKIRALRKALKS